MTHHRVEEDLLGFLEVPAEAYYGIQTLRSINNFKLSTITLSKYNNFIIALAMVKKAAAKTNLDLGDLDEKKYQAISYACQRIIDGDFHDQFLVDMIQGGAGTSTNMNANEVIANIALEHLGFNKGEYNKIHPNNDVNKSQSTNDVYPTAIRLGILLDYKKLVDSINNLSSEFLNKSKEFDNYIKMGRTQLQDAVPMTLGQEFHAFSTILKEDYFLFNQLIPGLFTVVNLGGTAIGTGINTNPDYRNLAINNLSAISGFPIRSAMDLVAATSDMGDFVLLSGMLKRLALKLSKICNDLRLLSSGPRTGLNEINLPARQPGSSIMPGKVNPVIPEAVNQIAFEISGNDVAISMAAEAAQLQLNAMEPLIAFKLFDSMRLLGSAMDMLRQLCIKDITANQQHCSNLVHQSIGLVTILNPYIGYQKATQIAKDSLALNKNVCDLVRESQLLDEELLNDILSPRNMIAPRRITSTHS